VFIIEESFAGTLEAQGFEERLMRLGPAPEQPEEPGQFWKEFIRETAPVFRKSTFEQLTEFIAPTFEALIEGARYVDERLTEIFDELEPDVIVEDNVVSFPAIPASGRPWVRIVSCNPTEVKDPELAPTFSGLPDADRGDWQAFREEYARAIEPLWGPFDNFCRERGAPGLPSGELIHTSEHLNLYVYPSELDYPRAESLGPTWHRLESSVRTTEEDWSVPDSLAEGEGALVYLSLGSLGSADVPLMRDLVDKLGSLPHRFVVSRGPQHSEYELAANMAGEEFLPQTWVLPEVDVVITHAGNNTTTECMHFGKPMIAMPLFWDQHDNAQRIDETGFGARLPTYGASAEQLGEAIGRLASDDALAERMTATASRLQANPGTERAAELIDRLATTGEPVLREG
jgi:MGT family glycosyltransferase